MLSSILSSLFFGPLYGSGLIDFFFFFLLLFPLPECFVHSFVLGHLGLFFLHMYLSILTHPTDINPQYPLR